MTSGGKELVPDAGAGWRNTDVGALPDFRGVKCCCKVVKAGLAVLVASSLRISRRRGCAATGSSGLETGRLVMTLPTLSDLVLTLTVRLNPASLVDAFDIGTLESDGPPLDRKLMLGATSNDLGLSVEILALLTSLWAPETLPVDCVRMCEALAAT
jgi:hypothetical protein